MADAATENRVLPEYHHLIVDEAHHLEDAVTDQLSFKADSVQPQPALHAATRRRAAAQVRRQRRILRTAGRRCAESAAAASRRAAGRGTAAASQRPQPTSLRDHAIRLQGDVEAVHSRLDDFWQVMEEVARRWRPQADNSDYDLRLRITEATADQPVWVEVEVALGEPGHHSGRRC